MIEILKIFNLTALLFVIISSCKSKKSEEKAERIFGEKKLEVLEFRPKGEISGPSEIYIKFNLPVTLVDLSIEPKVSGKLFYNPDEFSFSFSVTSEFSPSTKYRVLFKVEEIFSKQVSEFSWSFTTSPFFSGNLPEEKQEEINVPACFRNELIITLLFPTPTSLSISLNSFIVFEGNFHSYVPQIFTFSDNIVKNSKNELKIKAEFSSSYLGKITKEWIFYPMEDSIPPSAPIILKTQQKNIVKLVSEDNCSSHMNFIIFGEEGKKEIGYTDEILDLRYFILDSNLCVKAEDSAGNRSECTKLPELLKTTYYNIDIDCNYILPVGKNFLCSKNGETIDQKGKKVIDSASIDACPDQKILSDGNKIFLLREDFSISDVIDFPAKTLSCSKSYIIASDGERIFYKDINSDVQFVFKKDNLYLFSLPVANPEANIVDIFTSENYFFALFQNYSIMWFIGQLQGGEVENIYKPDPNLYLFISVSLPINNPDYIKIKGTKYFYSDEKIRKFIYFYDVAFYLFESGKIALDISPFSQSQSLKISDKFSAKDIFLNDIDGDGEYEMIIMESKRAIIFKKI